MTEATLAINLMATHERAEERPHEGTDTLALISLARAGDITAFDFLMRRYERMVLMTSLRLLNGNMPDAQDAAQTVFLRLHRCLGQFRDGNSAASFSPWLYRITVNICRDMQRRAKKRGEVELAAAFSVPAAAEDPAVPEVEIQRAAIAEGLKELGEKERAAIVLRDIEGLETREVASILGSSEATVRSQISVGRRKIRKFVEGYMRRRA